MYDENNYVVQIYLFLSCSLETLPLINSLNHYNILESRAVQQGLLCVPSCIPCKLSLQGSSGFAPALLPFALSFNQSFVYPLPSPSQPHLSLFSALSFSSSSLTHLPSLPPPSPSFTFCPFSFPFSSFLCLLFHIYAYISYYPKVKFDTPIYHVNVDDKELTICLGITNDAHWKPTMLMKDGAKEWKY